MLALASLALLKSGAPVTCTSGHCQGLAVDTQTLVELHAVRTPAIDVLFGAVTWASSLCVLLPLSSHRQQDYAPNSLLASTECISRRP